MPPDDDTFTAGQGGSGAAPRSAGPALAAGEVLAGRFRIVSLLGRGGMGDVYEADDLELGERVALKTIRADSARDETSRERFRREIQLARKVTHVNVCRTFELVRHEDLVIVSMELLRGETLSARLKRGGPMSPAEALPIIEQLVAGLAAAHHAAVVHRDFKCSNVLLVPRADGGLRAVVTDFGLAQSADPGRASVTATGLVVGTPAYMAPEQVEGKETSPATDIYALGLVMYEMLTGRLPFAAETPMSGAVKRLLEKPVSPRTLVPALPMSWEHVVLRCLERDPGRRFAQVEDVLPALRAQGSPPPRRWRRPPVTALVAALSAVALAGIVSFVVVRLARPSRAPTESASAIKVRRSIALVGFKNLSGQPALDWLSGALSEMLATELEAGEQLRVASGEDVAQMKRALDLSETESFGKETLGRIRRRLNVDLVVTGSFLAVGEVAARQVRLDVRVQDASTGETLAPVSVEGAESGIFDLVSRSAGELRRKLNVSDLSMPQRAQVEAARPSAPEAVRWYAEGFARWRVFDRTSARERFEKALAVDPSFALAHSALAQLLGEMWYREAAVAHARQATALAEKLPREERLVLEARAYLMQGQAEKATGIYRTLHEFFPDNLEYGLEFARLLPLSGANRSALRADAHGVLARLRRLPPPQGGDPRIDLVAARIEEWNAAGAVPALAALENVRRTARDRYAPQIEGSACVEEYLIRKLVTGEPDKAQAALEDAKRLFGATGDRLALAVLLSARSNELVIGGHLKVAEESITQALEIYREIGHTEGLMRMTRDLARAARRHGDLDRARRLYETLLPIAPDVHNHQFLGVVCFLLGDVATARREQERALAACPKASAECRAFVGFTQALMQYELGELRAAQETVAASAAVFGGRSPAEHGWANGIRGDTLVAEARFDEARQAYQRAIDTVAQTGEKISGTERRRCLAEIDLEEKRYAEAEAASRSAAEAFRAEGIVDRSARADAVRALALLGLGRTDEAQRVAAGVAQLQPEIQDRAIRLAITTMLARIDAALGREDRARESLRAAVADAETLGFVASALSARLALVEIEGGPTDAAARLARDARTRGFMRIARRATTIASPSTSSAAESTQAPR